MSYDRQGAGAPNFTPGPYETGSLANHTVYAGAKVVAVCPWGVGVDEQEAAVNAQLFAAAPELYEALYRLAVDCKLAGLDKHAGFDCWLSYADKSLAKARGEA